MAVNFSDEKSVEEFLENIGIEYRFGCYSEKKPDGKSSFPHIIGYYYSQDKLTILQFSCIHNPTSCYV